MNFYIREVNEQYAQALKDTLSAETVDNLTAPMLNTLIQQHQNLIALKDNRQLLLEKAERLNRKINQSLAEEPLQLINHIVKHDLTYTEVITADYHMLNDVTAAIWQQNNDHLDIAELDTNNWRPGYIDNHRYLYVTNSVQINPNDLDYTHSVNGHLPNSGLLTSPY